MERIAIVVISILVTLSSCHKVKYKARYSRGQTLYYKGTEVTIMTVNEYMGVGYYHDANYEVIYKDKLGRIDYITLPEKFLTEKP